VHKVGNQPGLLFLMFRHYSCKYKHEAVCWWLHVIQYAIREPKKKKTIVQVCTTLLVVLL